MKKQLFITLALTGMLNTPLQAADTMFTTPPQAKDEMGMGMGALIGGLIAGPPGAVIGAAGGAWFGDRSGKQDIRLADLESRLALKQAEVARLQDEFTNRQGRTGSELQKVALERRGNELETISQGVTLDVYFRTNHIEMDAENLPRIERLAAFLQRFPEIQLQLEAHADRRGADEYNRKLSRQRAETVSRELIKAGVDPRRIHIHAYGESEALAALGDKEGYVFDRRVSIQLTRDTEV